MNGNINLSASSVSFFPQIQGGNPTGTVAQVTVAQVPSGAACLI